MADDLNLVGMRYNAALTIFFPPYALLEVPSNIVLKILRPSIWIATLMFCWGTVMTLMGIVSTYEGLLITRFFLGVTESGFFPAATYLLTIWYLRYEVQRRMAVFYAAASLSGAFSGLLAYGISFMDGIGGRAGWQWIFLLEGLIPVVMSFFVWWLLPDNPETASFLTASEKEFIINRLALETGSGHGRVTNSDKIRMHHITAAFKEWKIWAAVVMFWANTIGVYGFTATVPSVIEDLGYSSANAQLMTIPIYVFAMAMTLIFAFWSDKIEQRTPFIMAGFSIACVGFIGELAIPHPRLPGVTYFFLFLVAAGLYSPFICIVCLIGNNLAPSSKRAVGMALLISIGNLGTFYLLSLQWSSLLIFIGGICGSNIYIASQAPKYPLGFGVGFAICFCAVCMAFFLRKAYQRENRKRDEFMAGKTDDEVRNSYTDQQLLDLGDRSPFYRYTV
jgi:MFS family permease